MERCLLAPDFSISRVVTGLWQVADMERDGRELDPEVVAGAMAPYVEAGLTTFDMADHYGSAELIAGQFLKRPQAGERAQILTKWVPPAGAVTRQDVRSAVRRSLDRLECDRLDLLQFHAWNYADPRWLDCLVWLQELRGEGLIRHLGLTNFDANHLLIAIRSGIEIASNQVCYSLLDQRPRDRLASLCVENGIQLLVYGTVAGGFLTERWLGAPEPDGEQIGTWYRMKYRRFIEEAGGWEVFQKLLQVVDRVARRHEVSMANVASRHILDRPAVGAVIIGARLGERDHLGDSVNLFRFTLDDDSSAELDEALTRLRPIPGNSGDEYRRPPYLTASGDLSHHVITIPPPYSPRTPGDGRSRVFTGTSWEEVAGYCRAVRHGNRIQVSGTTATHGGRVIGGRDPAAQLHFVIDKIQGALESLGGRLEDVVRTRLYIRNVDDWEPVSRAHGERFRQILPANTLVQAGLVGDEYLVEMEADAMVNDEGVS